MIVTDKLLLAGKGERVEVGGDKCPDTYQWNVSHGVDNDPLI